MYDEWYLEQLSNDNDSYSSEWEIFGFQHWANGTRLAVVEIVAAQNVLAWIVDQVSSLLLT